MWRAMERDGCTFIAHKSSCESEEYRVCVLFRWNRGCKLILALSGISFLFQISRYYDWNAVNTRINDNVSRIWNHIQRKGTPPPRAWFIHPPTLQQSLKGNHLPFLQWLTVV